jgi:hypothetical protein
MPGVRFLAALFCLSFVLFCLIGLAARRGGG